MNVSEYPAEFTESYTVRFWYTNEDGFYRQLEKTLYSNSKSAHSAIEKYALKNLSKFYKNFRIISVIYQ